MKGLERKVKSLIKREGKTPLYKEVCEMVLDNAIEYINAEDYLKSVIKYGCISGIVNELSCEYQIDRFYNKFKDDLLNLYVEYKKLHKDVRFTIKDLVYFGYEETIKEIANEIGLVY